MITNNLNVSKKESNYKRIDLKQTRTDTLKSIIKGQVLTEFEEPLVASVYVIELDLLIETNLEGFFLITLPEDFNTDYLSLIIEGNYHKFIETRIYKSDFPNVKKFYLKETDALTGIVASTYIKVPWWQFWKRF